MHSPVLFTPALTRSHTANINQAFTGLPITLHTAGLKAVVLAHLHFPSITNYSLKWLRPGRRFIKPRGKINTGMEMRRLMRTPFTCLYPDGPAITLGRVDR